MYSMTVCIKDRFLKVDISEVLPVSVDEVGVVVVTSDLDVEHYKLVRVLD